MLWYLSNLSCSSIAVLADSGDRVGQEVCGLRRARKVARPECHLGEVAVTRGGEASGSGRVLTQFTLSSLTAT